MADRIPCVNPKCKRTAAADKYEPGTEIVCQKCFKALPEKLRSEHRRCWREIRTWQRRITKTGDELKITRMHEIECRWGRRLQSNWQQIRSFFNSPTKPAGIDTFLEEMNLK